MYTILSLVRHNSWYVATIKSDLPLPTYHGLDVAKWPNKKEQANGDIFVWDESGEIYTFGLLRPKDPMHGNEPYMWSSRAACLGQILGFPMIDVHAEDENGHVHCGYAVKAYTMEKVDPINITHWIWYHGEPQGADIQKFN